MSVTDFKPVGTEATGDQVQKNGGILKYTGLERSPCQQVYW